MVKFHHDIAYPVQKISVVRDHQQSTPAALEIGLEILDCFYIEVVGGLIHYEEVGLRCKHFAERHSFDFSSGELSHFAIRVVEPEISEKFLDFLHKFRFVFVVTV